MPQLYLLDIAFGKLDKLTSHPTPVTGFDLRPGIADFIYSAEDPADLTDRARGYEVGKTFMLDVMRGNRVSPNPLPSSSAIEKGRMGSESVWHRWRLRSRACGFRRKEDMRSSPSIWQART